jgi:hypothetical protein
VVEPKVHDGERVLAAVIPHLLTMPVRDFDGGDFRWPPGLRTILRDLAGRSEQAATVARLACVSRATHKLAADLVQPHARCECRAKYFEAWLSITAGRDAGQLELFELIALFALENPDPPETWPPAAGAPPSAAEEQARRERAFGRSEMALAGPHGLQRHFIRRTWRDDGYNSDGGVVVARRPPPDGSGVHIRRCHSR